MNFNPEMQTKTQSSQEPAVVLPQSVTTKIKPPAKKPLTRGQKVADKMAAKVGSWGFLIGQSAVLASWITFNSIPGLPHFDQQPFILLNLVFSFASAYTAPVVLMSQNRQSEEDRENANHNYQVTLQAAQQLELLHEKLDAEYSQKLDTLTTLIQQQATNPVKVVYVPTQATHQFDHATPAIARTSHATPHAHTTVMVHVPGDSAIAPTLNLDDVQVTIQN